MAVSEEEKNADENISRVRAMDKNPMGMSFKLRLHSLII